MQHPYDKFDPVVESIRQASSDPDTLAIKMTLYRVSGDSPIIRYLGQAAQNGKQVTVLVEVKARFDEQNNVHWAKKIGNDGLSRYLWPDWPENSLQVVAGRSPRRKRHSPVHAHGNREL
ncbi:hypothetical protein [Secundilactobacillus collinoides]|uniref:hypothetical protein n=1 Tax=Secundilactobacillus collinoides TaxID=33960 RepID=UPI0024366580|nr:hypothetical protein [Secundilactobacillus collinoides]